MTRNKCTLKTDEAFLIISCRNNASSGNQALIVSLQVTKKFMIAFEIVINQNQRHQALTKHNFIHTQPIKINYIFAFCS